MILHRTEINTLPQTEAGRKLANEYADSLHKQGVLDFVKETTTSIKVQATYHFNISDKKVVE